MNFPGELIALITTLCWSLGIFPFTEATKRIGAVPVNTYRLLMALIIITLVLLIGYRLSFSEIIYSPSAKQYQWLILSGIIGFTLGDFFGFSSFVKLGPRLASLYTTLGPGFALFFGFIFLNEKINFVGLIGIGITIGGVIWLTRSKKENESRQIVGTKTGFAPDNPDSYREGIIFGIGSAFCQGLGLTLSKMGLNDNSAAHHISEIHANWIRLSGAFAAAFLFSVVTGNLLNYARPVFKNKNNGVIFMFAGTIFGPVLGVSFSLIAISKINVAVAQTIFALLPVFVLPLNYLFYKEKITLNSILACLVSICGVFVLIWREVIFSVLQNFLPQ
ncbi:MAG: DMT family transporter [Bacteroidia bacterium]|nr:DMT family transporter [Bacteroidia bacterium]